MGCWSVAEMAPWTLSGPGLSQWKLEFSSLRSRVSQCASLDRRALLEMSSVSSAVCISLSTVFLPVSLWLACNAQAAGPVRSRDVFLPSLYWHPITPLAWAVKISPEPCCPELPTYS